MMEGRALIQQRSQFKTSWPRWKPRHAFDDGAGQVNAWLKDELEGDQALVEAKRQENLAAVQETGAKNAEQRPNRC